jgi:hypothetical protein
MTFLTDGSDLNRTSPPMRASELSDWGSGSVLGLVASALMYAAGIAYASGYFDLLNGQR